MMPGMIMLWHGTVLNIPSGWHLCDGTAGTVDLRNKFIVCAGDVYNPGDSGGVLNQTHDFTGDGHYHDIGPGSYINAGFDFAQETDIEYATGTTDAADNRPPYYALCYIQKL